MYYLINPLSWPFTIIPNLPSNLFEIIDSPIPLLIGVLGNKESAEEDEYCCFFEIETHKKVKVNKCAGLTKFQYDHIKLYVKEKMDELLFRDLHIHCNSSTIKIFYLFLLFFAY